MVVIVAPSFAPASNPPTQRVRFFARHLPAFGWHPVVLSVKPRFYEERLDPEIEAVIPSELEIIRTAAWPASLTRSIGIGDIGIRSYWHLRRALRAICENRRPDIICLPGPPWHPFLLGPAMKDAYGIPYVLDYIDPWVNSMGADGRWWTKAYWYRRTAIALEPRAVNNASHVIAVSGGTTDVIRSWNPGLPPDRCTEIPYGVEPSDFDVLRGRPRPVSQWDRSDGCYHFAYVGAMLPRGYDTLRALFAALDEVRQTDPPLGNRIRVHFVGTTYDPSPRTPLVLPVAQEMGVADLVTEHPARVPYLDALNVLCSADGIVALGSSEAHYTASKIFPSIFARRPLLAIFHEASSVCDVVRRSRGGTLVTYSDQNRAESRVSEIADGIRCMFAYDAAAVRWDVFDEYTAERMTERLAAVLDRCVSS
jgi:hypothetical protein